jgi:hypothetical protein
MCCGQKRTELKNSQTQRIVQGGAQYARNNQGQSPGNQPATPSAVYPLDQPTDAWCTRPGDPSRFHQRSLSGEFCDPGARIRHRYLLRVLRLSRYSVSRCQRRHISVEHTFLPPRMTARCHWVGCSPPGPPSTGTCGVACCTSGWIESCATLIAGEPG